jgi:hypothetical protein
MRVLAALFPFIAAPIGARTHCDRPLSVAEEDRYHSPEQCVDDHDGLDDVELGIATLHRIFIFRPLRLRSTWLPVQWPRSASL